MVAAWVGWAGAAMQTTDWLWFGLVTAWGACVGSFLNVVIYRLPAGQSVISPPSHDPETGQRLSWWENIPLVSWVMLRGRSRYTGKRISVQYPLVELAGAVLAGGLFWVCYATPWREAMFALGWSQTWPVFLVQAVLLWGLLASTVVDYRYYIIPLEVPWVCTAVAVVGLPLGVALGGVSESALWLASEFQPVIPAVGPVGVGVAAGGAAGLALALAGLWRGWIPRSFVVAEDDIRNTSDDPDEFLVHPHPRREVIKEFLFVGFPLLGMSVGALVAHYWALGVLLAPDAAVVGGAAVQPVVEVPAWLSVLGGSVCGYLAGAGAIWGTRILGTLGFGKEAMGLGDVHLLGAVGAVVGAFDVTLVFFVAPFIGLAMTAVLALVSIARPGKMRAIPYGPYLAAAAAVLLFVGRGRLYPL